jgi:hypothetical protein
MAPARLPIMAILSIERELMAQTSILKMPQTVLFEAVDASRFSEPSMADMQRAVGVITAWWNNTAELPYRCANSFMLYVRHREPGWNGPLWLSGEPAEGWVHPSVIGLPGPANASLEGADEVRFWFFQVPVVTGAGKDFLSSHAKAVDDKEGSWSQLEVGEDALVHEIDSSFRALSIFPDRFPSVYEKLGRTTADVRNEQGLAAG